MSSAGGWHVFNPLRPLGRLGASFTKIHSHASFFTFFMTCPLAPRTESYDTRIARTFVAALATFPIPHRLACCSRSIYQSEYLVPSSAVACNFE